MHKVRVCVLVLTILTMAVHWWRTERRRTSVAIPSNVTSVADPFPSGSGSASAPVAGGAPTLDDAASGGSSAGAPAGGRLAGIDSGPSAPGTGGSPRGAALEGAAARAPAGAPAGGARGATPGPRDARPTVGRAGAISGTARDISGALLPGVEVQVRGGALGGAARTTRTGAGGAYRLSDLPEGTYTVTFARAQYQPSTRSGVRVQPARVTERIDGVLTPRPRQ